MWDYDLEKDYEYYLTWEAEMRIYLLLDVRWMEKLLWERILLITEDCVKPSMLSNRKPHMKTKSWSFQVRCATCYIVYNIVTCNMTTFLDSRIRELHKRTIVFYRIWEPLVWDNDKKRPEDVSSRFSFARKNTSSRSTVELWWIL